MRSSPGGSSEGTSSLYPPTPALLPPIPHPHPHLPVTKNNHTCRDTSMAVSTTLISEVSSIARTSTPRRTPEDPGGPRRTPEDPGGPRRTPEDPDGLEIDGPSWDTTMGIESSVRRDKFDQHPALYFMVRIHQHPPSPEHWGGLDPPISMYRCHG
jgi:hypothetical protein